MEELKGKKVCMLSDKHDAFDDRIYWKEALSLQRHGCLVTHICTGAEDRQFVSDEGIRIIQVANPLYYHNLILNKLYKSVARKSIYAKIHDYASRESFDVYHIHDLAINKIGTKLKGLPHRPKVVYDIHDPFAQNFIDYRGGKSIVSKIFSHLYAKHITKWQYKCARQYDLLITTEENLQKQFKDKVEIPVEVVYNYPVFTGDEPSLFQAKKFDLLYCGGITMFRGCMHMLEAVKIIKEKKPDISFALVGPMTPKRLEAEVREFVHENHLQENVSIIGNVPFTEVADYYRKSRIGFGIFLPIPTHYIILQIKIFEYMAFGLPIIGSNFGHISRYIKDDAAGITVDPESPAAIADATLQLLNDEAFYKRCSDNGRIAVQEKYRWEDMENKLLNLYSTL